MVVVCRQPCGIVWWSSERMDMVQKIEEGGKLGDV